MNLKVGQKYKVYISWHLCGTSATVVEEDTEIYWLTDDDDGMRWGVYKDDSRNNFEWYFEETNETYIRLEDKQDDDVTDE